MWLIVNCSLTIVIGLAVSGMQTNTLLKLLSGRTLSVGFPSLNVPDTLNFIIWGYLKKKTILDSMNNWILKNIPTITVKKSTSSLKERGSCSVAGILHSWANVSMYPLICSLKRFSMWCSSWPTIRFKLRLCFKWISENLNWRYATVFPMFSVKENVHILL